MLFGASARLPGRRQQPADRSDPEHRTVSSMTEIVVSLGEVELRLPARQANDCIRPKGGKKYAEALRRVSLA